MNLTGSRALKAAAYGLPLLFLAVVLYLNYLPFGYDRTFVIEAGSPNDMKGQFRLEQRQGLGGRDIAVDGSVSRTLSGAAFAVFQPSAYLRDARATAEIDADGVLMIPPNINFDPDTRVWDTVLEPDPASPACTYFGGNTQKDVPETSGVYDASDTAFSVYAAWTPEDDDDGYQLLAGNGEWELLQNKDDVKFQIGSTSVKQTLDDDAFFRTEHTALAVYVPPTPIEPNGHIDLYVDGTFSGRVYFQADSLPPSLGRPVTLGRSTAGEASFFRGCIHDLRITGENIDMAASRVEFSVTRDKKDYPVTLISAAGVEAVIRSITLHAVQ
ncbi:MAG: LamG-like jellyroll fold domain-containing protein [Patescibacteria group bacterium]